MRIKRSQDIFEDNKKWKILQSVECTFLLKKYNIHGMVQSMEVQNIIIESKPGFLSKLFNSVTYLFYFLIIIAFYIKVQSN